jgi:hypothetical protein
LSTTPPRAPRTKIIGIEGATEAREFQVKGTPQDKFLIRGEKRPIITPERPPANPAFPMRSLPFMPVEDFRKQTVPPPPTTIKG